MKIKEVRDEFGIIRLVDEEKRKIYDYSNRKKIVTWNAPMVEDGQDSHFWCFRRNSVYRLHEQCGMYCRSQQ